MGDMAEEECPYCGELIDAEATFCKHCGNDAETGWNPDADYESLELPEEEVETPQTEVVKFADVAT